MNECPLIMWYNLLQTDVFEKAEQPPFTFVTVPKCDGALHPETFGARRNRSVQSRRTG